MDSAATPRGAEVVPLPYGSPPLPGGYKQIENDLHQVKTPYGTQSRREWPAGDTREHELIDARFAEFLWRVSVVGSNVLLRLQYGTGSTITLDNLRTPLVAFVPGQVQVVARKRVADAVADVKATLTPATGGISVLRQYIGTSGALPVQAHSFTALDACVLDVAGNSVALAEGATLPLIAPASLTSGVGFVELSL